MVNLKPGDYRHEYDPAMSRKDVPAKSDPDYIQHVYCDVGEVHTERPYHGGFTCTRGGCILNKGI